MSGVGCGRLTGRRDEVAVAVRIDFDARAAVSEVHEAPTGAA